MKPILVIDNYDSFTYNLVHYLEDLDCEVTVRRNDQISLEAVNAYDKILLSPGPGIPDEAGLLKDIIATYANKKSILGICLGMQAIGEVFGGSLINLKTVYHGVATNIEITVEDEPLFKDMPKNIAMSLRHRIYDVKGVQFHPESVLTPNGKQILKNWIDN